MTVCPALVEEQGEVKEGASRPRPRPTTNYRRALQRLLLQQLAGAGQVPARQAAGADRDGPAVPRAGTESRRWSRTSSWPVSTVACCRAKACRATAPPWPRWPSASALPGTSTPSAWRLVLGYPQALARPAGSASKGKVRLATTVPLNDVKGQLANLVYPGFVRATPLEWLKEYPRYLKAIEQRLDKVAGQVQRDRVWSGELGELWAQYQARLAKHTPRKASATPSCVSVSLDAGGVPGLAVRPATGNPAAGLGTSAWPSSGARSRASSRDTARDEKGAPVETGAPFFVLVRSVAQVQCATDG